MSVTLLISIIIAIYLIPVVIYFMLGQKNTFNGSDHYTHQLFIDLIRENRYRFIREQKNIINENYMSYPQLMHWFMAILPQKAGAFFVRYLQVITVLLMAGGHFYFMLRVMGHAQVGNNVFTEGNIVMIFPVLIFSLTPYSFNINNAKNRGLSSRGLGVMLGQFFFYGLVLYELDQEGYWLVVNGVVVLIILLTNRFAYQYVLFATPFYCIFMKSGWVAVPLIGGTLAFFALFPVTAVLYFRGQWEHKKIYYNHLAKVYIFPKRKHIWGDFIHEFPIRLYRWMRNPIKNVNQLYYLRDNPLVMLVLQIPFMVIILAFADYSSLMQENSLQNLLLYGVLASVIVFFLTTFNTTRFLGEPERYLEFAIPAVSLLVIPMDRPLDTTSLIVFLVVISSCLLYTIHVVKTFLTSLIKKGDITDINAVKTFLLKENEKRKGELRVFAAETEDQRFLRVIGLKQFDFLMSKEYSSGFHIKEVFPERYDQVSHDIIPVIVERLDLNVLVVREKTQNDIQLKLEAAGYQLKSYFKSNQIRVFKIKKI